MKKKLNLKMITNESQVMMSYWQWFYVFQTPALGCHEPLVYMPYTTC